MIFIRNSKTINVLLLTILTIIPLILAPWTDDYFYFPKILTVYIFILIITGIHIVSSNREIIDIYDTSKILSIYLFLVTISTFFLSILLILFGVVLEGKRVCLLF